MNREAFLARVRASAAAGRAHRVFPADKPLPPIPASAPVVDLVAQMAREVELVGGHSYVVTDETAARGVLAQLLDPTIVAQALCWRDPLLARIGLDELLQQRGIVRLDYDTLAQEPPDSRKALMLAAQIGISSAQWGIA
ncbi:MAG TPA: hypothetical protein VHY20_02865, partial [Pirellulales bacterium]|nr:hypothetical protein [Pirellulales bacterium]